MSEYKDLCKWLRDHSSGVYRKSAEAAEVIENLEAKRDALQKMLDIAWDAVQEAGYEDFAHELRAFMEGQSDEQ